MSKVNYMNDNTEFFNFEEELGLTAGATTYVGLIAEWSMAKSD